jgi:hypothetical protein
LFGTSVAAVLLLGVKCRVDFFADWTFLFHVIPPYCVVFVSWAKTFSKESAAKKAIDKCASALQEELAKIPDMTLFPANH